MADVADIANERAEEILAAQLAKRVQFTGQSLMHCEDCDEEIPLLRRQTLPGVATCVDCQQLREDRRP
ncbi:MAG: TraR/DksA C4-type zinc finger protein [Pseudohongiella sp.]|nr:TraR/DksA C4-type zinc finger protein [Pseudohongiella sp.]